jgi:hypothetical protein
MRRCWALILLTAMSSASLDAARPAAAQQADEPEEAAAPPPRRLQIPDRTFDQWVFGAGGDAASARELGEARLRSRVGYIHQVCGLTAAQRKKLDIAGRGDIKRFFDRVAQLREELRLVDADINRIRQLINEVQAAGQRFRNQPPDEQSLFGKTLRTILDPEQAARCRRSFSEERLRAHQSSIVWVLGIVQRNAGLSRSQSLRLHVVLLEETRPPRASGPWDYFGIMYQAARIPEHKLRPIFQESEWRWLRKEFDEARSREAMLRGAGYLPEDPPDWETARGEPLRGRGVGARPDPKAPEENGAAGDPPAAGEKHA